jgi:hypothetical protein
VGHPHRPIRPIAVNRLVCVIVTRDSYVLNSHSREAAFIRIAYPQILVIAESRLGQAG